MDFFRRKILVGISILVLSFLIFGCSSKEEQTSPLLSVMKLPLLIHQTNRAQTEPMMMVSYEEGRIEIDVPRDWQVEDTIAGMVMSNPIEGLTVTMRSVPVGQNTGGKEFPIEFYSVDERKEMLGGILTSISKNNEEFQVEISGYTRTKTGKMAAYFRGKDQTGGAYSITFIWKENFIIVTGEASSHESFEKNKFRMENIVKTVRTR